MMGWLKLPALARGGGEARVIRQGPSMMADPLWNAAIQGALGVVRLPARTGTMFHSQRPDHRRPNATPGAGFLQRT